MENVNVPDAPVPTAVPPVDKVAPASAINVVPQDEPMDEVIQAMNQLQAHDNIQTTSTTVSASNVPAIANVPSINVTPSSSPLNPTIDSLFAAITALSDKVSQSNQVNHPHKTRNAIAKPVRPFSNRRFPSKITPSQEDRLRTVEVALQSLHNKFDQVIKDNVTPPTHTNQTPLPNANSQPTQPNSNVTYAQYAYEPSYVPITYAPSNPVYVPTQMYSSAAYVPPAPKPNQPNQPNHTSTWRTQQQTQPQYADSDTSHKVSPSPSPPPPQRESGGPLRHCHACGGTDHSISRCNLPYRERRERVRATGRCIQCYRLNCGGRCQAYCEICDGGHAYQLCKYHTREYVPRVLRR